MKKIKKIIVALAVAVMLPGVGAAMAQGWDRQPGMGMHRSHQGGDGQEGPRIWKALDLSPDQSQKMKELREGLFKESIPIRNEITSKRFELRALWAQTNPDEGKILAKQKEINTLRADLQEKVTKKRLEMRKILTPEQQAKWIFLSEQFRRTHDNEGGHSFRPAQGRFEEGRGPGHGFRN
jgi:Spy/CpxP family protein refolding chaperone